MHGKVKECMYASRKTDKAMYRYLKNYVMEVFYVYVAIILKVYAGCELIIIWIMNVSDK